MSETTKSLTTYYSWRWVFVGEVFVVIAILALTRRMADTPAQSGVKLDLVGTVLSALGLGLIVFGILRSGTWGFVQPKPDAPEWLGLSPMIWLLLAGGMVLFAFLSWENRRRANVQAALTLMFRVISRRPLRPSSRVESRSFPMRTCTRRSKRPELTRSPPTLSSRRMPTLGWMLCALRCRSWRWLFSWQ